MHFEIDSYEPTTIAIRKPQTDGHPLKSASPYEKTNSPATHALLTDNLKPYIIFLSTGFFNFKTPHFSVK